MKTYIGQQDRGTGNIRKSLELETKEVDMILLYMVSCHHIKFVFFLAVKNIKLHHLVQK